MGPRKLLKRVRKCTEALFRTHTFVRVAPPPTHPLRVWTSNGLDDRQAAGKWNQLDSLAPQPVAIATATQGTYGQSHPTALPTGRRFHGWWEAIKPIAFPLAPHHGFLATTRLILNWDRGPNCPKGFKPDFPT